MTYNKELFENLINENLSIREIGLKIGISYTSVRYWLKKFDLKTNFVEILKERRKISDEDILNAWNKTQYLSGMLDELGVGRCGGSYYHYKKRIKSLGVDLETSKDLGRRLGGKITAEKRNKIAIKQRKRLKRSNLKKSLELAGVDERCNTCGLKEWHGNRLKLHIHHIDHDRTNNNISNLEYKCPNCHSVEHYK